MLTTDILPCCLAFLPCYMGVLCGGIMLSDLDIKRYINQDKRMDGWLTKATLYSMGYWWA